MFNSARRLLAFGTVFAIVGSLLPWQLDGDFLPHWTYGISLSPPIRDNGGILIVLLSMVAIAVAIRPFTFMAKSTNWNIAVGIALVLDTAYHVGYLVLQRMNWVGLGAPSLRIGLILVCLGSILILVAAIVFAHGDLEESPRF